MTSHTHIEYHHKSSPLDHRLTDDHHQHRNRKRKEKASFVIIMVVKIIGIDDIHFFLIFDRSICERIDPITITVCSSNKKMFNLLLRMSCVGWLVAMTHVGNIDCCCCCFGQILSKKNNNMRCEPIWIKSVLRNFALLRLFFLLKNITFSCFFIEIFDF